MIRKVTYTNPTELNDEQHLTLAYLLGMSGKIAAIKYLRNISPLNLRDAKDAVERFQSDLRDFMATQPR